MKKYGLILIIGLLIVSLPAFAAKNMNSTKTQDSIKSCSYFKTESFVNQNGIQVKYKERILGYVNGKCRYVTESYYPNGTTKGMICDLNASQQDALYNAKLKNEPFNYSQCDSYTLINDEWVKDKKTNTRNR